MNDMYEVTKQNLLNNQYVWLVTGVAGFIGSNLLEELLSLNQVVVGLDNLSTGYKKNLEEVQSIVSKEQWLRFTFVEGDVSDLNDCKSVIKGVDHVLHQAALGSVPRSIVDPIASNLSNVSGFLNLLVAARDQKVKSFTYAASSSTYGDHPGLPKVEDQIGNPLSPYAVTKYVNELYADVFARTYDFKSIGLRYFNVFGKRQDPNGAYAAVIPKWIDSMINDESVSIFGDGETSRDFCYIENTVQANILSALAPVTAKAQVYNVALGESTSLTQLFSVIKKTLTDAGINYDRDPVYEGFRTGDVKHSLADISKAIQLLGYNPTHKLNLGLESAMPWYLGRHGK